jgi:hypothetical protein
MRKRSGGEYSIKTGDRVRYKARRLYGDKRDLYNGRMAEIESSLIEDDWSILIRFADGQRIGAYLNEVAQNGVEMFMEQL